ncbi:hypothetical protein [Pleomorphomonas sp. NRK KF1]|uniref:hypothetical protein n=1 Tax=Pleomorphomonas sp. NRK KF1 TaxID=2943000 RepID=UPI002044401C|nr:hypothetical protein [Pleomorphomonas sp. NRK KF1]MCM5552352.1 hypothetical protein [Pleomorphomonas sp. NRK KF1]
MKALALLGKVDIRRRRFAGPSFEDNRDICKSSPDDRLFQPAQLRRTPRESRFPRGFVIIHCARFNVLATADAGGTITRKLTNPVRI